MSSNVKSIKTTKSIEMDDKTATYKAMKYHYKIQDFLKKNYVAIGKKIPEGYEEYLKDYENLK